MRRQLARVLAAGLIGLVPVSTSAVPVVSFDVADTDIRIGERFTVEVVVDGVDLFDEVIAFGFDIDFDPSWTEAAAPVLGMDFMDDSALFPGTDVAGSVFPSPGPNGDGIKLATLSFVSGAAGVFDLGIVSHLLDPNEGLFTLFDTYDITYTARITVNEASGHVPEPATAALFGLGIAGVVYGRRRRKIH
jgi:hypothetical protein